MNCLPVRYIHFVILFSILLAGCHIFNSNDRKESPYDPVLDTSQSNLLFRWKTKKGVKVRMYGKKVKGDGVKQLTAARIQLPGKDKASVYIFDKKNRPTHVQTANGTEYWFSWSTDNSVRVTVEDPGDSVQVSFDYGFSTTSNSSSSFSQHNKINLVSDNSRNISPRAGKMKIDVKTLDCEKLPTPHTKSVISTVTVSKCGEPINNAFVALHAYFNDKDSERGIIDYGTPTGKGVYEINVPRPDQLEKSFDKNSFCNSTKDKTSKLCSIYDELSAGGVGSYEFCEALTTALSVTTFPAAVAGASCATLVTGLEFACNFSTFKCEAMDVLDWLDLENSDLFVYPVVTTDSDDKVLTEKEVPEEGTVPSFEVSFSGIVSIESLTTKPVDPDPDEDYIAKTRIYCPSPGTEVTFSIVGTDGYEKSKTVTLEESSLVDLHIPGSYEGVKDVITVKVQNGPKRSTSIVF